MEHQGVSLASEHVVGRYPPATKPAAVMPTVCAMRMPFGGGGMVVLR